MFPGINAEDWLELADDSVLVLGLHVSCLSTWSSVASEVSSSCPSRDSVLVGRCL